MFFHAFIGTQAKMISMRGQFISQSYLVCFLCDEAMNDFCFGHCIRMLVVDRVFFLTLCLIETSFGWTQWIYVFRVKHIIHFSSLAPICPAQLRLIAI